MKYPNLVNEAGWVGAFTRNQAAGAIPNGARVRKTEKMEPGDAHEPGALATVLGSIAGPDGMPPHLAHIKFCYFVAWDNEPRWACAVIDTKIERAE